MWGRMRGMTRLRAHANTNTHKAETCTTLYTHTQRQGILPFHVFNFIRQWCLTAVSEELFGETCGQVRCAPWSIFFFFFYCSLCCVTLMRIHLPKGFFRLTKLLTASHLWQPSWILMFHGLRHNNNEKSFGWKTKKKGSSRPGVTCLELLWSFCQNMFNSLSRDKVLWTNVQSVTDGFTLHKACFSSLAP